MFERLGHSIVKRSKLVLALFVIGILAAGGIGSSVISKLDSGGYSNPNSDSTKVFDYFVNDLKIKDPSVILIVDGQDRLAKDPSVSADAIKLESEVLKITGIEKTLSYWSAGQAPTLLSKDGKAGYLFIYTKSSNFSEVSEIGEKIQEKFDGNYKSVRVYATGAGVITSAINGKISKDLALAESISIPLSFLLLVFVFGAFVASAMPMVVGVSAILGAFFLLLLITSFTTVSIFALNLITGMGLGLGIDYSLLMVNRFREEIHHGKSIDDAVITTVKSAGKTVFYSGLTVAVTLGSMILFPLPFLKSFGYAGIAVVTLAIIGALIPLPAILKILGHRIDKGVIRKKAIEPRADGGWAKTARFVMKRPIPVVLLATIILGLLAAPVKDVVFSQTDVRVLPKNDKAVVASQVLEERFPGQESSPIEIIIKNGANKLAEANTYVESLSKVPGIVRINPIQVAGNDLRIQAIQSMGSRTLEGRAMIHEIRKLNSPKGTLVGGPAADFTDSQDGIYAAVPWALLWIALTVLILIFIFTNSIILPIKAVLLNLLSLCATLGLLKLVFIDGHFKSILGDFTTTGALDIGTTILVAVVVFGLSMDYELFLLSRIKEEHLAGKSNVDSVAIGLQRSARIITAAALILAVVFASFITSGVTPIKLMGLGTAFAVLLDATLVRALLVPALMRLFGEFNWWAPKFLRRFTLDH